MQTFTINISANVKTGAIPVSMSNSSTCPPACPFMASGCYAKSGPLAFIWQALDRGFMKRNDKQYSFGMPWKSFLGKVAELPQGVFWRHNQAGDLRGSANKLDAKALSELVESNDGKKGFTYTHYPMTAVNRKAVAQANRNGFTINLSGNSLAHADELKKSNAGPVVAVIPSNTIENKGVTPNGNRWVLCPAQQIDGMTCDKCRLCQKQRSVIVCFKAHGTSKGKIDATFSQN